MFHLSQAIPAHCLARVVLSTSFCVGLIPGTGCQGPRDQPQDQPQGQDQQPQWQCKIPAGQVPDFTTQIGCEPDFQIMASAPADESIPGALSLKIIVDRLDNNALYFQNSERFPIHWDFARQHLSGNGNPVVGSLAEFNTTEYYSPDRRFILGALSYYQGPKKWVFELSPYDTASAEMIRTAYQALSSNSYLGTGVAFHPTSAAITEVAKGLPPTIPIVSTKTLFEGVDYQPLNLGESYGKLRVMRASELDNTYVNFRDIVVLDAVPNDISVVQGIITSTFQTPLSHINVLSQNRKTPNMGLKNASTNPQVLALDGQWVRLKVDGQGWSLTKATQAQADAWWEANKPKALGVPKLDLETKELKDCASMIADPGQDLKSQIKQQIPAYGGKASHYGALAAIDSVPSPRAFAIPVFYYRQFMEQNGFQERVTNLLQNRDFIADAAYRDAQLKKLRTDMKTAPIDPAFLKLLKAKIGRDYPNTRLRFSSSTNAEDLDGFTGAGLYTSKSAQLGSTTHPIENAIRKVWASVWFFRAFEERSYRSINHLEVAMAILVHRSFPDEEANGVALTANPFDANGSEPGFYINVQLGEASVVKPKAGITSDQYVHHWTFPGQPTVFLAHSSLIPEGQTVLTHQQRISLGQALSKIHNFFQKAYGPSASQPQGWYAMDVEFKFDEPTQGGDIQLWIKQARPHPGRGN